MNLTQIITEGGYKLIDVREPGEYASGHLDGAINIPLGSIPQQLDELSNTGKKLILYCHSGNRSGQAAHFLKSQGIEEVYNGGSLREMFSMMPN